MRGKRQTRRRNKRVKWRGKEREELKGERKKNTSTDAHLFHTVATLNNVTVNAVMWIVL